MTLDLVVEAGRAITPQGERPVRLGVRDGTIVTVDADEPARKTLALADDEVLLPGLVDTHVHINDPGRTDWEGFPSATAAAAAGGVTTLIDMPLNSIPPTCDLPALELKRATATAAITVDVGFWGGAIPGNISDLRPLHDAGVFGFKCFLLPSGVEEFPPLDEAQLAAAMRELAGFDGLLIVHAEDSHLVQASPAGRGYRAFADSRPAEAENHAISQVIRLSRATGCRVHILHLASAAALPIIAAARGDGVRLTVETCPHYLTFTSDEIPDGATQFKCCPPIRDAANRDALWQGLADGLIDCVVTDHSPSTAALKRLDTGDFGEAWGGIASVQLGLPAVWTEAHARGLPLTDVIRWMAERTAALIGLSNKGKLAVGADADFSVFAPDETFVVDPARLKHKNPVTPYAGRTLRGVVRQTRLRGSTQLRGRLISPEAR